MRWQRQKRQRISFSPEKKESQAFIIIFSLSLTLLVCKSNIYLSGWKRKKSWWWWLDELRAVVSHLHLLSLLKKCSFLRNLGVGLVFGLCVWSSSFLVGESDTDFLSPWLAKIFFICSPLSSLLLCSSVPSLRLISPTHEVRKGKIQRAKRENSRLPTWKLSGERFNLKVLKVLFSLSTSDFPSFFTRHLTFTLSFPFSFLKECKELEKTENLLKHPPSPFFYLSSQ